MKEFTFYNPTRIEFGSGKEDTIGVHIASAGARKVLLCYGSERIKREGLFDTVSQNLADNGIEYIELGSIVSNPVISKVREGVELAKRHNVDAVLSVGGGSVLDSAKAIAAGAHYNGDVWDLFVSKGELSSALPLFAILTLAATGSEMNPYAVVTNEETHEKLSFGNDYTRPVVSVLSPTLMAGVSRDYLVYSAADIISHLIEVYFTATVQPEIQSRLVEALLNTVIETTPTLIACPNDEAARGEFAWAATLAQNGFILSGCAGFSYPNHAIEHSLSALFNVPHGAGLSVVMPAWMKWYKNRNTPQFERFAKYVFGLSSADDGIAALEKWFEEIGTPTRLEQLNIREADLPAIVENVQINVKAFGIASDYPPEVVTEMLMHAV
ncbi:iron-containing alcohol dehydrogenase [Escherichia coli]|nr:iron-containing alcohol dehydrogenase [Salmonella enterica subsp. enterica serovar Oslo]ECF8483050.1 iron-containing alcohol dehydrogenase [Salmonella enterica]EEZ0185410.1 iron-containing alcohol dehydrogenase [Escherichia coli]UGS44141.1 iron-containing alcohol dehydrogenase [Kosakonia cowanii]CAD7564502.1 NADH-dependent butanol dehydrogenase A [Citrobacter europaeus]